MDDTRQRTSFSLLRRWGIALNVTVSAVALLAIVIMVNYLADRHFARVDWRSTTAPRLSPLTRQVLLNLTNDVRITVLFDPEESPVFSEVKALLTEYRLVCPRLTVEFVDTRNKGRVTTLLAQYRITSEPDTLLIAFDTAGRPPQLLRERELSDFDIQAAMQGRPMRRTSFKGEQLFTQALLAMSDTHAIRAAYLTGHGEPELEDDRNPNGYARFAALLQEKNIALAPLSLRTNGVPEDCQLLVIAGPRSAIPPAELQKIERFLKAGGRALVLLYSPNRDGVRRSGLETLLPTWGIEVGNNLVLDRSQTQSGDTVVLTDQFGNHPITRPLSGSRVAMVMPCSVSPRTNSTRGVDATTAEALVSTSPAGMTVTQVRQGRGDVETNGVIPLAVASEKGAIAGVSADRGTTRIVAVGEASMLGNTLIEAEANRDFAGLAVNWLLDRRQYLDIGPRPVTEYRVSMTRAQMHAAAWVLLGGLPGSCLLLGLLAWLRRRK